MAFYLRKGITAGPFRFNLSKSGLGISTGIRGFRVGSGPRGNYVHMGRHGLYYRTSLDGGRRGASGHPGAASHVAPTQFQHDDVVTEDVTGATALDLEPTGDGDLVEQLNTASSRRSWWWPVAIAGGVLGLVTMPVGLIIWLISVPLCIWLYFHDQARRAVVVFYEVHDDAEGWFDTLTTQWRWLTESQQLRRITATGRIVGARAKRRSSGAAELVSTKNAVANLSGPTPLKTNVRIPSIAAAKSALYFLPDRLLVRDKKWFSDVAYRDLTVTHEQHDMIENSGFPSDATQVDSVWQHANTDGTPDRRFKTNGQLPVIRYGRLILTSPQGLHWVIRISRYQGAESLAAVISSAPAADAG